VMGILVAEAERFKKAADKMVANMNLAKFSQASPSLLLGALNRYVFTLPTYAEQFARWPRKLLSYFLTSAATSIFGIHKVFVPAAAQGLKQFGFREAPADPITRSRAARLRAAFWISDRARESLDRACAKVSRLHFKHFGTPIGHIWKEDAVLLDKKGKDVADIFLELTDKYDPDKTPKGFRNAKRRLQSNIQKVLSDDFWVKNAKYLQERFGRWGEGSAELIRFQHEVKELKYKTPPQIGAICVDAFLV